MEERMLSDEILLALIKKAGGDVSKVEAEVAAIKDGTTIDSFADVENALADKTDDDAVAPEFDNTVAYSAGNLVYHEGTLYKFDSDHAAGAWDASEVSPTTVAAEFNQLKNTLSELGDTTSYSGTGYRINKVGKMCILTIDGAKESFNVPTAYIPNGIYRGSVEDANGDFGGRIAITTEGYVSFTTAISNSKYGSIVYFV